MVTHVKGELTDSQIAILNEIFHHAIDGLGLGSHGWKNRQETPFKEGELNPYLSLQQQFLAFNKDGSFLMPYGTWHSFIYAYLDACAALDPWEMQTITNIEWIDAQQIVQDLVHWEHVEM